MYIYTHIFRLYFENWFLGKVRYIKREGIQCTCIVNTVSIACQEMSSSTDMRQNSGIPCSSPFKVLYPCSVELIAVTPIIHFEH